jgi:hypothetical protein
MNENDNSIFIIKPNKNWFTIVLSVPIIILSLFFIVIYIMLIYFEKMYMLIPFVIITILILLFVFKNLLWIFFGKIEIKITQTELSSTKFFFSSNKSNFYYVEEIESVEIKNLYFLQSINKIPLFGGIFLSLVNFSKKDSESILIKYRDREIEIINHLTMEQAKSIVKSLDNLLNRTN